MHVLICAAVIHIVIILDEAVTTDRICVSMHVRVRICTCTRLCVPVVVLLCSCLCVLMHWPLTAHACCAGDIAPAHYMIITPIFHCLPKVNQVVQRNEPQPNL